MGIQIKSTQPQYVMSGDVFACPSSRDSMVIYLQVRGTNDVGDTVYACSCPGFLSRQSCRHIDFLIESEPDA